MPSRDNCNVDKTQSVNNNGIDNPTESIEFSIYFDEESDIENSDDINNGKFRTEPLETSTSVSSDDVTSYDVISSYDFTSYDVSGVTNKSYDADDDNNEFLDLYEEWPSEISTNL